MAIVTYGVWLENDPNRLVAASEANMRSAQQVSPVQAIQLPTGEWQIHRYWVDTEAANSWLEFVTPLNPISYIVES